MGTPSTSAAISASRSTSLPPGSTERTRAEETPDTGVATAVDRLHRAVTDTIVAQLEADPGPWSCPWHRDGGGLPRNALTRQSYHGINILSLWIAEQGQGFASDRWATYRQWQALGAQVRQGEKGTAILFYKDLPQSRDADAEGPRFVARASFVFNAAQVEGAPDEAAPHQNDKIALTSDLDYFAAQTGALIREGETACYRPSLDEIQMPARHRFISADGYSATLSHELVHWTGHPRRLNRQLTTRFGTRAYAAEELIAELGAAFVLARLGLASTPHPNHASYIAHWLPLLRADPRALVTAAAHATRAAAHLARLQSQTKVSTLIVIGNSNTGQGATP